MWISGLRARVFRPLTPIAASLLLMIGSDAWALPAGGEVVGGAATIKQPTAQTLHIEQTSDRALLNWQGFSIGQKETVQFLQPSATSLAVNRVLGGDPSIILGNMLANGRVFLLNPNGVVFGSGSVVNVGGLLATTLSLQRYDLNKGEFSFAQDPTTALAAIVNQGSLRIADHGFVTLTAPGVVNDGLIVAKFGQVGLHAGTQMTVDFRGDGLIQYAVDGKVLNQVTDPNGKPLTSAISNAGRIEADGGTVLLTAQASSAVLSSVINQTGVIQARRLEQQGGEIVLRGGDEGIVMVAGTLDARGATSEIGAKGEKSGKGAKGETSETGGTSGKGDKSEKGETGGRIDIRGEKVGLTETARLDVSGNAGGGTITVGGGFQGKDGGQNAQQTVVWPGATLLANVTTQGDGGTVIVWADGRTQFGGAISARGGPLGGNGGFVEVSGKENLIYRGTVDLRASLGQTGTLLLDPKNILISPTGATYSAPYGFTDNSSSDVTILDTGPSSLSEALDLASVTLQANTDITFQGNAVPANAAHVTGTTSGNGLTLNAGRSIIFEQNSSLTLNNGAFTATINDASAIPADRDAGTAQFVMNGGSQILTNGGQVQIGGSDLAEVRIGNGNGPATIDAGATPTSLILIGGVGDPGMLVDSGSTLQGSFIQLFGNGGAAGGFGVRLVGPGTQLVAETIFIIGSGAGTGAGNVGIELIDGVTLTSMALPGSNAIVLNGSGADTAPGIRTTSSGANNSIGGVREVGLYAQTASGTDSIDLANLLIHDFVTLTLLPMAPGDSIGLAGGTGVFNLSAAELASIQQGTNTILIGQADGTHAVTVGESVGPTGYDFSMGNVTIRAPGSGGTIMVDGPLAVTNGNLSLAAGTQITVNPTGSLTALQLSLSSEALALNGGPGSVSVGQITLEPINPTTSIGIGDGAAGSFVVDSAMLALIETASTELAIGRSDGQHVITIEAVTFQSRGVAILTPLLGGGGSITVNGPIVAPGNLALLADAQITISSTGSVTTTGVGAGLTLIADALALNGAADSISGSGPLILQPNSGTTSIGIGDGVAGAFHLTNTELLTLKDGFSDITIGRESGIHEISIETVTFRDPVVIQGGSITVNGALATTGTDFLGLLALSQITVNASASVRTVTGGIAFTADAIALNGAADSVSGSGVLILQPYFDTTSIGIGNGAAGTFNLTSTELLTLKPGFGSINIGNSVLGQHVIDIQSVTFRDLVSIWTPVGGSIHVNGTLRGAAGVPIRLIGSGATTTLNADIVTNGQPITIDDSVIVAGGTDVTRTLDTTNGGTVPAGADITVTGTINAQNTAPSNESLTVQAGTTGDVALGSGSLFTPVYNRPIGGTEPLRNLTATGDVMNFPQTTLTGALSATGATGTFNGQVVVGANGSITMTYSGGMFLFADMISPNAVLSAIGPVTLMHDVVLDVGLGTLTMQNTVDTQIYNFTLRGNGIDLLGGGGSIVGTGTNVLELAPGTPATSLGIAGGAGTLQLDAAELTPIGTGVDGFATVRLGRADSTATITLGTYTAPYAVTIQADAAGGEGTIHVTGALATGPAGEGLTLLAGKNILVSPGASVTTNHGPLTLTANAAGTATGPFVGIDVNGGTLSSGTGALALTGTGGTSGASNYGVRLRNGAQVQTTEGLLTMTGTGGSGGTSLNAGVHLEGASTVTSGSGPITLIGLGGTGTGSSNRGVDLLGSTVSSSTGAIELQGTGGATSSFSYGIVLAQGQVTSGGNIILTGQGGPGGPANVATLGMLITNGSHVEGTGSAQVSLLGGGGTGTATSATNGEVGLFIHGQNGTFIRTANGDLTVQGTGNGTGIGGQGLILRGGALVESTGSGNVVVTGAGSLTGSSNNNGIQMIEAGTTVRSNTGNLSMTGTAHGALNSTNNIGLAIASGAIVQKTGSGGTITLTGFGGDGGGGTNNFGIALLSTPTHILANNGTILITGTGMNGAGGVTAQGGFLVGAPGIPCASCAPTANLDAGTGGTITINSTP